MIPSTWTTWWTIRALTLRPGLWGRCCGHRQQRPAGSPQCSPARISPGRCTPSCTRRSPPKWVPGHPTTRRVPPPTSPRAGRPPGTGGALLHQALTQATLSGAAAEFAGHYARAVIGAAYRRSYYAAAASLAQAAAELPEHELFAHLLSIGRAQRAASQRLSAVRVGTAETPLS